MLSSVESFQFFLFLSKHLKKNIQDIEITRCQVSKEELLEFDKRIGPSYERALAAIDSFMKFQAKYNHKTGIHLKQDAASEEVTDVLG